ncbi:MAG: endonuclease/exonuclease/phosphatase family protein [Paludibacteraceae bacterium]|nr:endonuclease/exonuclease/phosphatase family protein [Paludibacteraceae bacterium]
MLNHIIIAITILTWNTHQMGQFRKPDDNKVLQYLVQQDADIICLQEVDVYKNTRYLTLSDVKRTLSKKYPYSYIDFAIYNQRHQYGTMVWSKFPLINKQSIHYQSRGNISNRCDIVIESDTIRLINNHLESYSFTTGDLVDLNSIHSYDCLITALKRLRDKWRRAIKLRNEQARIVRREIDESPYPVITVGDFNSTALGYAYWHISSGMHDAWRETHPWEWGATCEKRSWGVRIDYILSSDSLKPITCTIPALNGSDHHPVVATLTW